MPASELVDTHVPMDRRCLEEVERISAEIACSRTFFERVRCFEQFMGCQKNKLNKTSSLLKPIIDSICRSAHEDHRQRFAHISDRHTRRLFNRYVGVSPIYFKRIVRHQKAIKALNRDPYQGLAGLSAKLGYCDQSHFIHEFKRFHGMSPVQFLKTYIRAE